MNIILRDDEELRLFSNVFRKRVAGRPCHPDSHEYVKTPEAFQKQMAMYVLSGQSQEGHNHLLRLVHHDDYIVSVSLTLDQDESTSLYHLSMVSLDLVKKKHTKVPNEIAHKLAAMICGPNWHEEPHPGVMIPQIRHFLAPNVETG